MVAAAAFAAAAALAGCAATPQATRIIRQPPPDLAPAAQLKDVPFYPQQRYQCGPAALATVLTHAGYATQLDALVDAVYVPAKRSALRTEMRAAARARGAVAYPLAPELETVLREIAAGNPVLVRQNLGLDWWPRWQYAVAVGYELGRDHIVLRSGETRRRIMQLATFERTWMRADRWAQVIVAPDDPPATAEPLPWLRSVRELEQTGATEAAIAGYRAATRAWPETRAAWLALGNALLDRGEVGGARDAFMRTVELDPKAGAGWDNLAHALAASGCGATALRAARCAVRLGPDNPEFDATLDELKGRARVQALDASCSIPACPIGQAGGDS